MSTQMPVHRENVNDTTEWKHSDCEKFHEMNDLLSSIFLTFLVQLVFHVCVFVCVCFHVHTSVLCCMCEGQKTTGNKIGSFFPLCRFWHLNSFYQALQQAVLYTIASDFPTRSSDRSQMIDKSQSVEVYHIQEIWHADILLDEMM